MKFLLLQLLTTTFSVMLLSFLTSRESFSPWQPSGEPNWYNITLVGIILFIGLLSLGSLISFTLKKRMAYGKKEYPPIGPSLTHGAIFALGIVGIILLNLFHILALGWGLIVAGLILLGWILVK